MIERQLYLCSRAARHRKSPPYHHFSISVLISSNDTLEALLTHSSLSLNSSVQKCQIADAHLHVIDSNYSTSKPNDGQQRPIPEFMVFKSSRRTRCYLWLPATPQNQQGDRVLVQQAGEQARRPQGSSHLHTSSSAQFSKQRRRKALRSRVLKGVVSSPEMKPNKASVLREGRWSLPSREYRIEFRPGRNYLSAQKDHSKSQLNLECRGQCLTPNERDENVF